VCGNAFAQTTAQSSVSAPSPRPCWDSVVETRSTALTAAHAAFAGVADADHNAALTRRLAEIDTTMVRQARACASRFTLDAVVGQEDLVALLFTYKTAGMDSAAWRAYDRYAKFVPDSLYPELVRDAMLYFIDEHAPPSRLRVGEAFVAALDTMTGDRGARARITGHTILADGYPLEDPAVRRHAEVAYAAARSLSDGARARSPEYGSGVLTWAEQLINDGDAIAGLRLLRTTIADVGAQSPAGEILSDLERRYGLIGTVAPPITGVHWVHNPRAAPEVVFAGHRATLFTITAPWCGACKQLDPIIEALGAQYRDRGVQTVFVAPLEGDSTTRSVRDAVTRYARLMPSHVSPPTPTALVEGKASPQEKGAWLTWESPAVFAQYQSAFPCAYVVDGGGVIRAVQMGYSRRSRAILVASLDRVLAATSSTARK